MLAGAWSANLPSSCPGSVSFFSQDSLREQKPLEQPPHERVAAVAELLEGEATAAQGDVCHAAVAKREADVRDVTVGAVGEEE